MSIYISTNLYEPEQLPLIFDLMDKIQDPLVGIELFPEWHSPVFCAVVQKYQERFVRYPSSLHGPYYHTEHSKREGTKEYTASMGYFRQTLALAQELHSSHIVYHHNNCQIKPETKEEMLTSSARNLTALRDEAKNYGVKLVVENAGVKARGNMLFDEAEFIQMAATIPEAVLLDVGHAHANQWDVGRVIRKLAHKIAAYHLHNNDGYEDRHSRILDGTFDFASFFGWYLKYTPKADLVVEYGKQCAQDVDGIVEDVTHIKQMLACR